MTAAIRAGIACGRRATWARMFMWHAPNMLQQILRILNGRGKREKLA
jgi:hypothetical protein